MKKTWPYLVIIALLIVQVGLLWVIHTNMVPLADFQALEAKVEALQTPVTETPVEDTTAEVSEETLSPVTVNAAAPQVLLYQKNDLTVSITAEAHNYTTGMLEVTLHVANASDKEAKIVFSKSHVDDTTITGPAAITVQPDSESDPTISFSLDEVINAGVLEWYTLGFDLEISSANLQVTIPVTIEADAFYQAVY